MEKEELAKQYRIQQYIDFGDLNERAEQQIEQAFIDGYEKALNLFGVSHCATQVNSVLSVALMNIAKKNIGKKMDEIPEFIELLNATKIIDKHCG